MASKFATSVLNRAIRKNPDDKPPLIFFKGFPVLIFHTCLTLSGIIYFPLFGIAGHMIYLALCVLVLIIIPIDGLVSNSHGSNITMLRNFGYSDLFIVSIILFNLMSSQTLGFLIVYYLCQDIMSFERITLEFTKTAGYIILALICNLIVQEITFTLAHRLLHTTMPDLHLFHHICRKPSWLTNLLFHPIDLAFEFTGPVTSILIMHFTCWNQNKIILLVSYIILQLWYAYDHDEWVRSYHYNHHERIDSHYTVYIDYKFDPSKDTLKKLYTDTKAQKNIAVVDVDKIDDDVANDKKD